MNSVIGKILMAGILGVAAPQVAGACSLFVLQSNEHVVFGQNLDWDVPLPGHVVVNKRGVWKAILPWEGHWPAIADSRRTSWISQYGSVTFTCYGRDFIEGGMNEAGLVVDQTSFVAEYPPPDDRPGVCCAQWMQYQLDNFATVAEVVAHVEDLRPDGEGWHYMIADSSGDCAVIEYRAGKSLVLAGDAVPVRALTNSAYRQALHHVSLDVRFGGSIDVGAGTDSYGRFVRLAALLQDPSIEEHGTLPEYALHVLAEVGCSETRRSVAYDATERRVVWTTDTNPCLRWLDFAALSFGPQEPTQVLDVDAGGPGEVSPFLVGYTPAANRSIAAKVLSTRSHGPDRHRQLEERGLTIEAVVDLIGAHPTR